MADVYLGKARSVGGFERLVAIKVCHDHLRREGRFVEMFLDEARLAAKIHHPNVVATIDVQEEEHLYLVMEYIEGGHLAALTRAVRRRGERLPIPIALRIFRDALRGLHEAHELEDHGGRSLNLIHCDISPQNLLVGTDGLVRITDFGVAKAEAQVSTTRPGEIKGKCAYLAPEQLRGMELTRQVDIFSAAVVLWETLTGERLFRCDSAQDTFARILSSPIRSVSAFREGIPSALDECVRDGLERDPTRRLATAKQFAQALEECGIAQASIEEVGEYVSLHLKSDIEKGRSLVRSAWTESTPPYEAPPTVEIPFKESAAPPPRRPRRVLLVALVLIMVLLGTAGAWLLVFNRNVRSEARSPKIAEDFERRSTGPPAAADTHDSLPAASPDGGTARPDAEAQREQRRMSARRRDRRSIRKTKGTATPRQSSPGKTPGPTPEEYRPVALGWKTG